MKRTLMGVCVLSLIFEAMACERQPESTAAAASWAALMADGDVSTLAGAASAPSTPPPPRFCTDCTREPLAYWTLDDCNPSTTQLQDAAFTSSIAHPAFRAVSAACVAGASGQAVKITTNDDLVYAPDQPDFQFDQGLTIAAWIQPSSLNGTQSIVRKRFDGSSAFTLAIDGRKLTFVVNLASGKLVGVTAPIQAGRLTHVAATYDGQRASLYVDGALAASARAKGTLAAGAGPILIGNDIDGRQMKGIVDEIWLNTLAAPADVIKGLTCLRKAPLVTLSPATSPATPPGTPVAFDLAVTNTSDASCPVDSYSVNAGLPFPLSADPTFTTVSAGPGQTAHATITVTAADAGVTGPVPFSIYLYGAPNFMLVAQAGATFVVAPPQPPSQTGCPATPSAPVAPGGYYVNGNTVCTPDGRPHIFRGVDRPSLEWSPAGDHLSLDDFQKMAAWGANVVRIGLNQDFWLSGSQYYDPSYATTVQSAVAWAEQAGMDVLLDLHWSDAGVLGGCPPGANGCQQLMPDANSVTFWSEVANQFKNDGRVTFELYNEPHDVPWTVWRNGGDTGQGWQAVGMQQLYDTVRATGAQNLVLIGGLNWAYDLSGVPANRIAGYNIMYATHPYTDTSGFSRPPSDWGRAWGFLTATDPVVVTEFGVLNDTACTTAYPQQVIQYADAHFAGWTAWAWYPGGCTFPSLINDWTGTPSAVGAVVEAALLGHPVPPPSGPTLAYTFDTTTQGWAFDSYDDPNQTNLAVHPPASGAPTLTWEAADGDPNPGALKVTASFTAFDQYLSAAFGFGQPGTDLSGKVLHAHIRLVSGSFPQGAFQFFAATGASYAWGSTFVTSDGLPPGAWRTFDLDLGAVTAAGYDPAHVVQMGVQFFSGFSSGGGTFTPTDAVFEIDTVTD